MKPSDNPKWAVLVVCKNNERISLFDNESDAQTEFREWSGSCTPTSICSLYRRGSMGYFWLINSWRRMNFRAVGEAIWLVVNWHLHRQYPGEAGDKRRFAEFILNGGAWRCCAARQ